MLLKLSSSFLYFEWPITHLTQGAICFCDPDLRPEIQPYQASLKCYLISPLKNSSNRQRKIPAISRGSFWKLLIGNSCQRSNSNELLEITITRLSEWSQIISSRNILINDKNRITPNSRASFVQRSSESFPKMSSTRSHICASQLEFRKYPTHQGTKKIQKKLCSVTPKFSNSSEHYYLEPGLWHYLTDIVEGYEYAPIRETQSHEKFYCSDSFSKDAKSWESPRKWRIGSLIL